MSASAIAGAAQTHRVRFRTTVTNIVNVTAGEGLLRIATFGVALAIAREHGTEVFGQYAMAIAASTVAMTLADNGLQVAALEQIAKRKGPSASTKYSQLLLAKMLLSGFAVVVLAVALVASHQPTAVLMLWSLVCIRTLLQSFAQLNFSALKALQRTAAIGMIQCGHALCLAAATLVTYTRHMGVVVLLAAAVLCQVGELAAAHRLLRKIGIAYVSVSIAESFRVVRENASLGLTATVSGLVLRFDVLCLSLFASPAHVGLYAAAQWPVVAFYVAAWLFGSIVLADMATMLSDDSALRAYVKRWSLHILWIAIPVTAFAYWAAPTLVPRFFGQKFRDAAAMSSLLLLATPFIFLNSLHLNQAIARRESRVYAVAYIGSVAVAAAFVLVAAKWLGMAGVAAVATVREAGIFLVLNLSERGRR